MTLDAFRRHFTHVVSRIENGPRLEAAARELAAFFDVEPHEVGIFQIDGSSRTATFRWPPHTGSAINIPLKTFVTSLVAATARERRGIVDNTFAKTPHLHMFELGLAEKEQRIPLQRIMSVPVSDSDGSLRWIIQISRKGRTIEEAGRPFTDSDLRSLEELAETFAQLL